MFLSLACVVQVVALDGTVCGGWSLAWLLAFACDRVLGDVGLVVTLSWGQYSHLLPFSSLPLMGAMLWVWAVKREF